MNSNGVVVWAADYKPFGEATITVSTITNNLRFPGQYYDAETGNNYNSRRDYDTSRGRYIEADPVGQWGGINPYLYAWNNPLYWTDPSGLEPALASCHGTHRCVGQARVLQGNPNLIGQQGGFPNTAVAAGSAAVIPAQWGGNRTLRPSLGQVSGSMSSGSTFRVKSFSLHLPFFCAMVSSWLVLSA